MRRARKIQQFLSQPFFVAEQFTGIAGRFVPLKETVRSFKEIIEGKHDDLPEQAFRMQGASTTWWPWRTPRMPPPKKVAAAAAPAAVCIGDVPRG